MLPKKASFENRERAGVGKTVQGKDTSPYKHPNPHIVMQLGEIKQTRVREIIHSFRKNFGSSNFLCHVDQAYFHKSYID